MYKVIMYVFYLSFFLETRRNDSQTKVQKISKGSLNFTSNYEMFILGTDVLIFNFIFFRKPETRKSLQVFFSYLKSTVI